MSVYFNSDYLNCNITFNEIEQVDKDPVRPTQRLKAPQRIGDIWERIRIQLSSPFRSEKRIQTFLERLGIPEKDLKGQKAILHVMQEILKGDIEIAPSKSEGESGVYFLSRHGVIFAVFKVGEKRADLETSARDILRELGLEDFVIPGVFCTITNPTVTREPIIIELHNGNQKVIQRKHVEESTSDHPLTMTGILEPFANESEKADIKRFALSVFSAIVLGLRDCKKSGMDPACTFYDVEEIMPWRFNPKNSPFKVKVAATHIPYIEEFEFTDTPLPYELICELYEITNQWDIYSLLGSISQKKVRFADAESEDLLSMENLIHGFNVLRVIARHRNQELDQMSQKEFEDLLKIAKMECFQSDSDVQLSKAFEVIQRLNEDPDRSCFQNVVKYSNCAQCDSIYGANADYLELKKWVGLDIKGWDQGGYFVQIEKTKQIIRDHKPKQPILENPYAIDINQGRLFSRKQIEALQERMERLKEAVKIAYHEASACREMGSSPFPFSIRNVVCQTDLMYRAHYNALKGGKSRFGKEHIGRFTPIETGVELSSEDEDVIRNATSSSPNHSSASSLSSIPFALSPRNLQSFYREAFQTFPDEKAEVDSED